MARYALPGEDALPWCARFVRTGLAAVGFELPGANPWKLASAQYMHDRFKEWGLMVDEPKPGDIVFLSWHGKRVDHVGIVEQIAYGRLWCIEGNTDNAVRLKGRPRKSKMIVGFARPE